MRKIAWLPQTSGPPTAKSKRGGQQDAGRWRWIEFCGETAIAAVLLLHCSTCPLVLWPPQLAWHALLPPVLGMSSLWPFSRCGAQLLLWFAGDAGAPLGMWVARPKWYRWLIETRCTREARWRSLQFAAHLCVSCGCSSLVAGRWCRQMRRLLWHSIWHIFWYIFWHIFW